MFRGSAHESRRVRQLGVSLIELMVALVLGLFLILGAVTVYQQSRSTFRVTEAVARLQETARYALDVLEPEIRMASYWGLNNRADYIQNRATAAEALPAVFNATQGGKISTCGNNWAINVAEYIGGSNNAYFTTSAGCLGQNTITTADTLIVRRGAELPPTTLDVNDLYVQASRVQGTMFAPTAGCTDPDDAACLPVGYAPPASETRELVANAYYISSQSTGRTDVPSLRRKRFLGLGATAVTDEEIIPGVEDMQVQFGIDGTDADDSVDAYVNPGAVGATDRVMAVRIWLRIRADDRDFGHVDGNSYQYADMATAFTPNDNYRRILVSKTIQVRNSRS
jgi:type IV pilus assembly protein PilW